MKPPQQDLELALELADRADEITMARYRARDLQVETKPDRTPVTEADRAVERALRERLGALRPDDGVVGEEFGEGAGGTERRWIIDPIDGTKSYLRGMPTWSTLIALEIAGEVVAGIVSMPALGRRWWAARGAGARSDGRPIRVSGVTDLANAQLCWSDIEAWDEVGRPEAILSLARACWRSRGIGDAWQYMLVAEGAAEIALDPSVSLWDLAAVKIIVEEAGGVFTDLQGVVTAAGGSGLATNGILHQAALEYVGFPPGAK
jgi:histidinol-phosphatase